MPADTHFPGIAQPNNDGVVVWRYMDLPKYLWMLAHRSLWLTQLGALQDEFEGAVPVDTVNQYIDSWQKSKVDLSTIHDAHFPSYLPRKTGYVSCWTLSPVESDVMWRLYGGGRHGVAIRSTYSTLVACLDEKCFGGVVEYVDHDCIADSERTELAPVFWKRREFFAEQEVRVVKRFYKFRGDDERPIPSGRAGSVPTLEDVDNFYDQPRGIPVVVDLSVLVSEVVVNPYADDLFFAVVEQSSKAFGLVGKTIGWSNLKRVPPVRSAVQKGLVGTRVEAEKPDSTTSRVVPGIPLWTSGPFKKEK